MNPDSPPATDQDAPAAAPEDDPHPPSVGDAVSVQKTRAIAGLLAVVLGDVAIIAGTIVSLSVLDAEAASGQSVAILTSAFTAISTMTTAYFGIRAATNTAQSSISARGHRPRFSKS